MTWNYCVNCLQLHFVATSFKTGIVTGNQAEFGFSLYPKLETELTRQVIVTELSRPGIVMENLSGSSSYEMI